MATLTQQIEQLKQSIPHTPAGKLPDTYCKLARLLHWVNLEEQKLYLGLLLQINAAPATDVTSIQAQLMLSGNYLNQMETEKAFEVAEAALTNSLQTGNETLIISAQTNLILCCIYNGRTELGEDLALKCLAKVGTTHQRTDDFDIYVAVAYLYTDTDLTKAFSYALKALEVAELINEKWRIGYAASVLAFIAGANGNKEQELEYYLRASALLKEDGAMEYYLNTVIRLSTCYNKADKYDIALQYLHSALQLTEQLNNKRMRIVTLYTFGRIYRYIKNFEKCIDYYKQALLLAQQENNTYEEATIYALLSPAYSDMGDMPNAIWASEKAIELYKQSNRFNNSINIARLLHVMYYKNGDTDKAYQTLLYYIDGRLKLQDESRAKEMAAMQARYETERKDAQLKQLQIDNLNSELKLLKSQMNPHFMFNIISTISNLVQTGNNQQAQHSLQRLSVLTRGILEQSADEETLLEDEIAFMESYLHLEGLALGNDFSYHINVSHDIDTGYEKLPALLIQPIAENALKHGLRHKSGPKVLTLGFTLHESEEHNILKVTITDNGIGRTASAEINKHRVKHQSFATKSIEERIRIINTTSGYEKIKMHVADLYENGQPAGTQVTISVLQ